MQRDTRIHRTRRNSALLLAAAAAAAIGHMARSAQAASFWDPANTGGTGSGGTNTWDTLSPFWYSGTDGAWPNTTSTDATFAGTAGIVTLGEPITAHSLSFTTTGYTITGNSTNTLTIGGTAPTISTGAGLTATISALLSGNAGITTNGGGTLILSTSNSYSGATTIGTGVLELGNASALPGGIGNTGGTSGLTINGGVLGLGVANSTFARALGSGVTQFQFTAFNTGGFAGYASGVNVNVGNGQSLTWSSSPTAGWLSNGSQLILGAVDDTASVTLQNNITFGSKTQTVKVVHGGASVDGILSGALTTGNLSIIGNGTLELAGAGDNSAFNVSVGGTATLLLAKTSTGSFHAVGGTLTINLNTTARLAGTGNDQLWTGSTVAMTGGTFDLNGTNEGFASLTGSSGTVTNAASSSASTLTVGEGNSTSSYGGLVTDGGTAGTSLSLVKTGTGTLGLSGNNSLVGTTTISAGTLRANNMLGSATGSGNVTVSATASGNYTGGTLGGNGTVSGTVTLSAGTAVKLGGIIAAGSTGNTTTGIGTLTSGNQTWNGGAAYQWKIKDAGTAGAVTANTSGIGSNWDELVMNGLTVGNSTNSIAITIAPLGNLTSVSNGTYNWVIGQIGTGNATTISVNGTSTGNSTSNNLLSNANAFALDTSGLTVNGGADSVAPGNFSLFFETVGISNDLVLSYNAAPEPGTGLLILTGGLPMLLARRRRRKLKKNQLQDNTSNFLKPSGWNLPPQV